MTPMAYISITVFITCVALTMCNGHNILLVPYIIGSHLHAQVNVGRALVEHGHDVTIVLNEKLRLPPTIQTAGIKPILYKNPLTKWVIASEERQAQFLSLSIERPDEILAVHHEFFSAAMSTECELLLRDDQMFNTLAEKRFDLVIVDGFVFQPCLYLVSHRLGVPHITLVDHPMYLSIRVPWLPSFVPFVLLSHLTDTMTFPQRFLNTLTNIAIASRGPFIELSTDLMDKYRSYGHFESFADLATLSDIWLVNRDSVLQYIAPTMPNLIEVGGLSTKASQALDAQWEKFIRGANEGVILVSFGTSGAGLPHSLVKRLLEAFRQVPQKIIWRLQRKIAAAFDVPENVFITDEYIPQNDIMGHPKTKLFISHCGINGLFEALYHGVPIIGVPIFGDQRSNGQLLNYKGFGIGMDINTFNSTELLSNIRKVLTNSSYTDKIRKASAIFRSRPETPMQRAVFWIEHVLRFGGDHLRSPSTRMPLCQYWMLDVMVAMMAIVVLVVVVVWKVVRYVWRRCCRQKIKLA